MGEPRNFHVIHCFPDHATSMLEPQWRCFTTTPIDVGDTKAFLDLSGNLGEMVDGNGASQWWGHHRALATGNQTPGWWRRCLSIHFPMTHHWVCQAAHAHEACTVLIGLEARVWGWLWWDASRHHCEPHRRLATPPSGNEAILKLHQFSQMTMLSMLRVISGGALEGEERFWAMLQCLTRREYQYTYDLKI